MNSDEEGSEEEASESEEEEQAEDPFENIDALSDEEAKEELREAQQRRLMEESQVCLSCDVPCISCYCCLRNLHH